MSEAASPAPSRLRDAARVIVVGSVMFSFISYWRTAAVVLCDLGSTAYYIGGIVEQTIGAAAPWFILAVMLFSYAVRSVYIESCSLFIRGGVYRVVKEALGRFFAKLAVSALIFDYLLTGPISGVSAGHYLMGLALDSFEVFGVWMPTSPDQRATIKAWGAVAICIAATLYFYRLNILGIHESSDRALKIMYATTVMAVVILVWCGLTLATKGIATSRNPRDTTLATVQAVGVAAAPHGFGVFGIPAAFEAAPTRTNALPILPDLSYKAPDGEEQTLNIDPTLGFLTNQSQLRLTPEDPFAWLSIFGVLGILIAFGHSILAMSGEETLAQVYREVEAPKLQNFRKAAFIVFIYSLVFTAGISFLAVMLIPEDQRVTIYQENLISGLAMNVIGPPALKLFLNAFVVIIGFLILSGAVNTAIIGSNGVLNRVAEDGVMPDWFLKPHPRFGTTYRILTLIVGLQLVIIVISRGDVILLGEAYAFGVVWSFVFQALSMVVLRFKDPRPREYRVPFNVRIGGVEIPFGLLFVLFVLFSAAVLNLLTKQLATYTGLAFTATFFTIFLISEKFHDRRMKAQGGPHKHLEQFNEQCEQEITPKSLGLARPYRKLVSIRSPYNLFMLEKALDETDPETTDLIVMTARSTPAMSGFPEHASLDQYDQELMTAVVQKAEAAGKPVHPVILPTNNALYAILKTAADLGVQEVVLGASNKYTADEQLDQIAFYWMNLNHGEPVPLTVRVLARDRDVSFDIGGGNRIPKHGERRAQSVAELRQAGVGVDNVLLVHEDSQAGLDLYQGLLTMLDPKVALSLVVIPNGNGAPGGDTVRVIREQAAQLDRPIAIQEKFNGDMSGEIVRQARDGQFDLIVLALPAELPYHHQLPLPTWAEHVVRNAPCRVFLASHPPLPKDLAE